MNLTANKIDLKDILLAHYKTAEGSLLGKGIAEVEQRKQEALDLFQTLGFPSTKHEEWKYTNMLPALKKDYSVNPKSSCNKTDIEDFIFKNLDANILIFINGVYSKELSKISGSDSGLVIKNISEAEPEVLKKYFASHVSVKDAFTALNTAYASHGAYIKAARGKVIEKPIVLHFISDARTGNVFSQPRNLILAEENAQVKVIETYNTLGDQSSFTNAYTEIVLQKEAHVEYYKIENESDHAAHVGTTQVFHEAKSTFSSTTITLQGDIIRNNLNIVLNAPNCESTLYGLYYADGSDHIDNHTLVDHAMPNCYSNELYKGLMNGKSTAAFNGKIFVREDAQKTNAFQSNKNILLSKDAAVNTKPQLEIFADDVKCSHGATIGQFDKEPLFYLRSRGMSEASAKALLMQAFAQDIIDHIKIDALKESLQKQIVQRLTK